MADEIANSAPPVAASPAAPNAEAAPSSPSPAVTESAPATTETVVPEAPKTEAAPAETPVPESLEAAKAETLLGGEKKAEEKPAEAKPEEKTEEKSAEAAEAEVPPLPSYEPFTLPEGVTFEAEKMGEFTKTLAEFENTTKASHEEVQKLGQQLVDRHVAELKSSMERYAESLTQAWEKQKTEWKDSFLKDPEFANRTDTVVNKAIDAIGVYAGTETQQKEFRELMESTGVGNHPAMIRLLSNVMLAKAEPKPLAAPQIATPKNASKIEKMYGKKGA